MSDADAPLSGPDLAQGIPLDDIGDGGMVLGHAHGEPVLLVRQGSEVFAVGANCTHYNGPLAEGLIVGETVRCPWHHACFSLRTGEALRAPALNPVPRWRVEKADGKVRVGDKLAPPPTPSVPTRAPEHVVIVGAGAAGEAAAEMLRREGFGGRITMLEAGPDLPVDRPNLSKDYLAGTASEDWVPLRPEEFFAEHRIDLRRGCRVEALDAARRTITLENGETVRFDALLLATGADPVHLPIPGGAADRVHYLRTWGDSRAIIEASKGARRAVVLGASFIGLEVAASLRTRGLEVHVVAPEQRPLERVLGPEFGSFVRGVHEEHGVNFHLGSTASKIESDAVVLEAGDRLGADLVVIGVGVRPNLRLAEAAGLTTDRGVVVNQYLETSAPGIYAAGDIARWPDPHTSQNIRVEHWVVAQRQGQTAARNILGRQERFDAVPFFWSNHYDIAIAYVGHAERWDRITFSGSLAEHSCLAAYWQGPRVVAVATLFRDRESLQAEVALEQGDMRELQKLLG